MTNEDKPSRFRGGGTSAWFSAVNVIPAVLTIWLALATPAVALLIAGAGHGWCSPIQVSWLALITVPLTTLSWILRRRWWGQLLGLLLLAVLVAADYTFVELADGENPEYFHKVWTQAPHLVLFWFLGWFCPQIVVLATLVWGVAAVVVSFRRKKISMQSESDEP